ncbi:Uncharacterised protein [Mycobacteroides abscessus]|nr:Uncharacterised protein [Mycobacteroides abscessus]
MPTLAVPTTAPSGPNTGTLTRHDSPSVPVCVPVHTSPESGTDGSVETLSPMRVGSGWEYRTPSSSVTTTYVTSDASRMTSAIGWIVAAGSSSSNASMIAGRRATENATAVMRSR